MTDTLTVRVVAKGLSHRTPTLSVLPVSTSSCPPVTQGRMSMFISPRGWCANTR